MPGCPNWSEKAQPNFDNRTMSNFGCGVNGNMAAMIANPEDLLTGQKGTGETVIMSSTKAIETYRTKPVSGAGELKASSTGGGK